MQVARGELDEAERFSHIAEDAASVEDIETQVLWRSARGKVFAERGQAAEAEALLREAWALIEPTEQPDTRGMVLFDLAKVLWRERRAEEVLNLLQAAKRLFDEKGNLVSARKVIRLQDEVRAARHDDGIGQIGSPAVLR